MESNLLSHVSGVSDLTDLVAFGHNFTSRNPRLQPVISQLSAGTPVNDDPPVHGGYVNRLFAHFYSIGAVFIAKVYNSCKGADTSWRPLGVNLFLFFFFLAVGNLISLSLDSCIRDKLRNHLHAFRARNRSFSCFLGVTFRSARYFLHRLRTLSSFANRQGSKLKYK